ncbi:MAG: hypothetical protein HY921_00890 [Elusimicrobia bacterium]|nr:hypothetical protein [Elusimicrobiota bacterium]
MKTAGEEELFRFLGDIDALLEEGLALYILGGAAAVIAYGSGRGTIDIDAYLDDERLRCKLSDWAGRGTELARRHGLYFDSANAALMLLEPDWKDRCVEILKGRLKHIQVMALGKEDLILSKLSRYNDRDREDIQFMVEKHRPDVKKLVAYYKAARQYYVGHLPRLDQTFNILLQEHFKRRPIVF